MNEPGVRPTESGIAAVKHFREPKTIAQLRSFLGLITYVGRFIPNFRKNESLRRLLQAGVNFKLRQKQQEAFNIIKQAVCETKFFGIFRQKIQDEIYRRR